MKILTDFRKTVETGTDPRLITISIPVFFLEQSLTVTFFFIHCLDGGSA